MDTRSRNDLDRSCLLFVRRQRKPGRSDLQVHGTAVDHSLQVVIIFPCTLEGPHSDVAVARYEELIIVIVRIGHTGQGLGIQRVCCRRRSHQRFAGRTSVPVHEAVCHSVESVGIISHIFRHVGNHNLAVRGIVIVCIETNTAAAVGVLQPLILAISLEVEFAVLLCPAHYKSSFGCCRQIHVVGISGSIIVHVLLYAVGICVNIVFIISSGLEEPRRSIGTLSCACLHIYNVAAARLHCICEIDVIAIGKVEPFLIVKILCQLIDRCHFLDRNIDGLRPFHDRISREPIRRKADGIPIHLKVIDHIASIASVRKVNDPGVFA